MYVSPGLFYFQQFIFKKFKFRSESSRKVQFKDFWRKLIPPYLTLPQIKYWHLEYYVYFGKHISTNLQFKSPPPPPSWKQVSGFFFKFSRYCFCLVQMWYSQTKLDKHKQSSPTLYHNDYDFNFCIQISIYRSKFRHEKII